MVAEVHEETGMDPAVAAAVGRARDRGKDLAADILSRPEILAEAEIGAEMWIAREAVQKAYTSGRLPSLAAAGVGIILGGNSMKRVTHYEGCRK